MIFGPCPDLPNEAAHIQTNYGSLSPTYRRSQHANMNFQLQSALAKILCQCQSLSVKTGLKQKLIPPSKPDEPYNFTQPVHKIDLNGQYNQPIYINHEIFKNRVKNGFFLEAGAYDGETYSNSLYFELKHNWTGILIEANPDAFMDLKLKHRKSWLMGNCLSTKEHSEVVDFDAAGLLGGIIHDGKRPGRNPVTEDKHTFGAGLKIPGLGEKHTFERRTLRLECYPLYTILNAIGNPTVHYFRYVFRIPTFNGYLGKKVNSFLYHLVPKSPNHP